MRIMMSWRCLIRLMALWAQDLSDKVCALLGIEKKVIAQLTADQLIKEKAKVHHPFIRSSGSRYSLDTFWKMMVPRLCIVRPVRS